jgi:hypothetical protein
MRLVGWRNLSQLNERPPRPLSGKYWHDECLIGIGVTETLPIPNASGRFGSAFRPTRPFQLPCGGDNNRDFVTNDGSLRSQDRRSRKRRRDLTPSRFQTIRFVHIEL